MELYINNQQLHITKGDVSLNWTNIRFDDAVADEWSTEVEMPNDKHNIGLLDAYGLLDRGALFNHKIKCSVMVSDVSRDGYLQILSIDEVSIKARVFLVMFPYAVLDKKVCEYYPHNDIVYRWDRFSPITTNIAGVNEGIIPYTYTTTDFYSNFLAQWHASASVSHIIDLIQTAEDITLPAVSYVLWQLAARKKVCPSNPYQVMMGNFLHSNAISDKNLELSGGQHITNDFKSNWTYADLHWNYNWSDWLVESTNEKWMENAEKKDVITFNRDCTAHIKVYACASHIGGILIPQKNGQSLAPAPASSVPVLTNPNWTESDILIFDDYVTFSDGDELTLHYSGSAQSRNRNVRYTVVIEYSNYDWNEDDYDVDLEYIPAPFGIWGIRALGSDWAYDFKYDLNGSGNGTHSLEDYSFTYFGVYTNLDHEMTVRQYISDLCWVHNRKLKLDHNELIFQSANVANSITANMMLIEPFSDKLGQTNTITYRDAEDPIEFEIDNEFLEYEVNLHTSNFYTADELPQYSYEMTYSEKTNSNGDGWITDIKVNFEDLSPVLMQAVYSGSSYTLGKAPELQGFGLPDLTNATQITWETFDTVYDCDFVYVDGKKYMVISGEEDVQTGLTELVTLQCDSIITLTPPENMYTFTGGLTYPTNSYDTVSCNVTANYGSANFTLCGVQLCTDPDFNGQIISGSSYSQTFNGNITGLQENTTYYYRYFAESTEFGYAIYTPSNNSFTTNYAPPVLVITHENVTETTASVIFIYTGNYPIDPTAMSGVIGSNGQTIHTLQFDHLAVGVPEVVNLSGLTPNTVYDVSWDVDYYNGEVSAVDNFTTSPQDTGSVEINDMSVFDTGSNKMIFKATYKMGKYGADTTTFRVMVYDEYDNLLADFIPTVSGDAFDGALTRAAGIALPEKCQYVKYQVVVTNKDGYTNSAWVEVYIK